MPLAHPRGRNDPLQPDGAAMDLAVAAVLVSWNLYSRSGVPALVADRNRLLVEIASHHV
jgi:hypothetical protein